MNRLLLAALLLAVSALPAGASRYRVDIIGPDQSCQAGMEEVLSVRSTTTNLKVCVGEQPPPFTLNGGSCVSCGGPGIQCCTATVPLTVPSH